MEDGADPLFELGYGLTYGSTETVNSLSEDPGLGGTEIASTGNFYSKGAAIEPWSLWLHSGDLSKQIASFPTSVGGLIVSKTDQEAQEDALRIKWTRSDFDQFRVSTASPIDMARRLTVRWN